jgi:hypothetical protein
MSLRARSPRRELQNVHASCSRRSPMIRKTPSSIRTGIGTRRKARPGRTRPQRTSPIGAKAQPLSPVDPAPLSAPSPDSTPGALPGMPLIEPASAGCQHSRPPPRRPRPDRTAPEPALDGPRTMPARPGSDVELALLVTSSAPLGRKRALPCRNWSRRELAPGVGRRHVPPLKDHDTARGRSTALGLYIVGPFWIARPVPVCRRAAGAGELGVVDGRMSAAVLMYSPRGEGDVFGTFWVKSQPQYDPGVSCRLRRPDRIGGGPVEAPTWAPAGRRRGQAAAGKGQCTPSLWCWSARVRLD